MAVKSKKWGGIDGCKGGWILAETDGVQFTCTFLDSLSRLNPPDFETLLIDIPLSFAKNDLRVSEVEAKKRLGKRRSTLFLTPVKEAVFEKNYQKGLEINRKIAGRGFSKQAFFLFPKIQEALFLKEKSFGNFFESHPELCFLGLSGEVAKYSKKTKEGRAERLELIKKLSLEAFSAIHKTKHKVFEEDLIDAVLLALAAMKKEGLTYLGDPPEDVIVY